MASKCRSSQLLPLLVLLCPLYNSPYWRTLLAAVAGLPATLKGAALFRARRSNVDNFEPGPLGSRPSPGLTSFPGAKRTKACPWTSSSSVNSAASISPLSGRDVPIATAYVSDIISKSKYKRTLRLAIPTRLYESRPSNTRTRISNHSER